MMLDHGVPEGLYTRVERMECPSCGVGLREFSAVDSEVFRLVAAECPGCGGLFEVPGTPTLRLLARELRNQPAEFRSSCDHCA
jgi:Zn-finger nucleic acid-binding protein